MNYNKDKNIFDTIFDQNNKSKFMLVIYVLIFAILVIFVRVGGTGESSKKNNNNSAVTPVIEPSNNDDEELLLDEMKHTEEDEKNNNSIYNRFSFLRTNNYSFSFVIDIGKKLTMTGQRYNSKYNLKMTNEENDSTLDCLADGNVFKVLTNGDYEESDYPIFFVDYFNNNVLYNIIYESTIISDKDDVISLNISNEKLSKYIHSSFSSFVDKNKKSTNEIIINLKKNKISEIYFDFSNILKENGEYKNLKISLKYDSFTQIDDFDVDF